MKKVRIAPPNSIVLMADSSSDALPPSEKPVSLVVASPACLGIGCRMELDGETEITMGAYRDVAPSHAPLFDGVLETPSRSITIRTVADLRILDMNVPTIRTRVRVWANHSFDPDEVTIGLG